METGTAPTASCTDCFTPIAEQYHFELVTDTGVVVGQGWVTAATPVCAMRFAQRSLAGNNAVRLLSPERRNLRP